jgi:multimeric flavodoxin WrbA
MKERTLMKTLLGLVGSPRKYGNSELFIKELYRNLPQGWQLKLIRLPELDIRPCRACYRCLFGEMQCQQDDDFPFALQALCDCDAYVLAAPTYLLGASACLKGFLDRGLSFYGQAEKLWQKPAVGVATAGIRGKEGYAKLMVDSFIRLTLGDHRGSAVVYGALPGEIFLDGDGKAAARELAEALVGKSPHPEASGDAPACPLCGGDTFRFLPDGTLRCMLCSSSGSYEIKDGKLHVRTEPGDHPFFFSYEDVVRHADWLRGMKDQFMARRKELKTVTQQYAGEGEWIRPE